MISFSRCQRTKIIAIFLIFSQMVFVILTCSLSLAAVVQKRGTGVFRPGDGIRIRIWQIWQVSSSKTGNTIEISGDYEIDSKGYVDLPVVGKVRIGGQTAQRVVELLKEEYSAYLRDPIIIVRPLIRITMQGAFNRPGSYRIDPESSLWELVALAGGPNESCDLKKIRVERGGKTVLKDLLGSFEKGYSLREIGIQSGDQILAPSRSHFSVRTVMNYLSFGMTAALFYYRVTHGSW